MEAVDKDTFALFGEDSFQSKLILGVLTDISFAQKIIDIVDPDFFTTVGHRNIFEFLKGNIEENSSFPTLDVVKYWKSELEDGSLKDAVEDAIEKIDGSDYRDLQYVKDKSLEFCRNQAMKNAILRSADLLQDGDYDAIHKEIEHALLAGKETEIGHDYFQDSAFRNQKLNRRPIPTGLGKPLDDLMGGGVAAGELACLMAPTGIGKSMGLINVAYGSISSGLSVVYYTLELSEPLIGTRMDARVCGLTINNALESPNVVAASLTKKKNSFGELLIKQFPTKQATTTSLKAHLVKMRATKFTPDLMIVDYADLLKPSRSYKEKRHELEGIYEDLRGMAIEMQIPVWTATQSNRGSMNSDIVTLSDISESFAKAQVADFVISIQRSIQDKKENKAKVFVAKSRTGRDGITFDAIMNTEAAYVEVLPGEDHWFTEEQSHVILNKDEELDRKDRLKRSVERLTRT